MDEEIKKDLTYGTHKWWTRLNKTIPLSGKEIVELQNFLAWVESQVKGLK